jgi:hypothetical protein
MHQNKFVTDFFIKSLPQYAFRHLYIAEMRMGVNFYEEISDKLVLVHLLV